jgi:hypothetical protein
VVLFFDSSDLVFEVVGHNFEPVQLIVKLFYFLLLSRYVLFEQIDSFLVIFDCEVLSLVTAFEKCAKLIRAFVLK